MGQRHQFFVIARVRPHGDPNAPPRYRCVAAYDHQWTYGRLALCAMRRLLDLIKQKDNGEIIRAEIHEMHGKYGEGETPPSMPGVPAPFAAFLLGIAATTDLELDSYGTAYMSGHVFMFSLLNATMGCWEEENDDGISVVDVTDPDRPAYCFLTSSGPLTAEMYVREYYSVPSEDQMEDKEKRQVEEEVLKCIKSLDGEKLITLPMLAETWPDDYSEALEESRNKAEATQRNTESTASEATLPSLSEISLKPAVLHALETDDTTEVERMLDLQPSIAPSMKTILRQQTVFEPSAMRLLIRVLDSETSQPHSLDLSEFALSSEQVVEVVSSRPDLNVLNLSYNTSITGDTVQDVLHKHPHLRRLVLFGCPSVTDEDLYGLQQSEPQLLLHMEAFMHPAFLDIFDPLPYACGFTFLIDHKSRSPRQEGVSLPFFTPTQVIQAMTHYVRTVWPEPAYFVDRQLPVAAAFSSGSQLPGERWGNRSIVNLPMKSFRTLRGEEEGWVLVVQPQVGIGASGGKWGFLWCTPGPSGGVRCQAYDVQGFVRLSIEHGRPPPPSSDVEALEALLKAAEARGTRGWHLMTPISEAR